MKMMIYSEHRTLITEPDIMFSSKRGFQFIKVIFILISRF